MSVNDVATQCMEDLVTKLNTAPAMKDRVVTVYTENEMMDVTAQLKFPCAGVIYEGMRSVPDSDKGNKGLSVELVFAVMLLVEGKGLGNQVGSGVKSTAAVYLDQFRNTVKNTRSPGSGWWKFMVEAAVESKGGSYTYMQRWSTPATIT